MKKILDLILSIIILPLLLLLVVFISFFSFNSKGPLLHWSLRCGKEEVLINMPKFRTMYLNTPIIASELMDNPDKYITRLGVILRKSSIDELPQVWCVLKGEMSWVGPRPALYNQTELIELRRKYFINNLLPGITGWAQINGRDNLTIEEKVKLDKYYYDNRSLYFDIKILFLTIFKVILRKGIKH